jgi:FSR family fosmidomycin resistance protein-like MFS transporter
MPHELRRPGLLQGAALAIFLAAVHTVNDAITAILGALLPTLQVEFDLGPTALALIVAVFWIASSVTQPLFGALAEDIGARAIGALGVLLASLFLSLIGVAPALWIVFVLLIIGGMGSAALHPVGTTVAAGRTVRNRTLGVAFFTAGGMVGFAAGPILILYLVSYFGTDATPWLMVPGVLLSVGMFFALPQWEPHGRRPLRSLFDFTLVRGPVGLLALAGSLASVAFVTFTSSLPLWLVDEHGYEADDPRIGWTLGTFAFAAGAGALLGGVVAPRIGRRATIAGSLALAAVPLLALLALDPGTPTFYIVAAIAGVLIYTSSPVKVVVAQELAPTAPAAAAGMILGTTAAIAGAVYILLGRIQAAVGLDVGIALGFSLVIPASLIALAVFARHPEVAH